MFFQPPADEPTQRSNLVITVPNNPRNRRLKKLRRKKKQKALQKAVKKNNSKQNNVRSPISIPLTMSSWAENFTKAATWQLKQQVAHWKSKAIALEYENKILHDVIRKNYLKTSQSANSTRENCEYEEVEEDCVEYENETEEQDDGDIEVSEEFIQFLRDNKKYRDDAKRERERLKALNDHEQRVIEEMEAGPAENVEDPQEVLKRRYGSDWEKISALETSLRSQFVSISDSEKPVYWPNIPLNFNFG